MILDLRPHWIWVGKNPKGRWGTSSHTLILLKCDSCNKEFERPYRTLNRVKLNRESLYEEQ